MSTTSALTALTVSATSTEPGAKAVESGYARRIHLAVLATYVVLSVALSWPLPLHLSTHLTGDPAGDTGVYVWNLWHFRHELLQGGNPFYTSALFVPTGRADLSLHNYTVFTSVLSVPLQPWLGLIATFNVLYLALGALSAYAMFLLARHVSGNVLGASLAGVLFAFSPFMTARGTSHFSLVAAAPLPIFALLLLKAEETAKARYAVGAGLTLAWALYCDPYYAVFCVLVTAAHLAYALVSVSRDRNAPRPGVLLRILDAVALISMALAAWIAITGGTRVSFGGLHVGLQSVNTPMLLIVVILAFRFTVGLSLRPRLRRDVPLRTWAGLSVVAIMVATLALLPFLYAVVTRLVDREFVVPATHWRSSPRGVDALAYLMPNPNHRLFGRPGREWLARQQEGFAENAAALTMVAPVVIALGFRRRRPLPTRWAFLALFFALLALGPFVWVGGLNTHIPTPWALLRYAPGIGLARSPGRFAVLVTMALSVLFALAVTELLHRKPRRTALIVGGIGAALLFELAPVPRPLYSAEISPVFRRIAEDPRDVRVLELPTGLRDGRSSTGDYTAETQFHQTVHGKSLVGGYLSRVSATRVRACRRFAVLDALFTVSAGERLTPKQRRLAFARRAHFLQRSRVGYVVMDRARVSEHLRRFAIRLLGLAKVDADGRYELYAPDPSLGGSGDNLHSDDGPDEFIDPLLRSHRSADSPS